MTERLGHPLLQRGLALILGAVFVYASLDKIANPADFARIVYHYQLVGPNQHLGPLVANLLAVTLPWIELVMGGLLLLGAWRREAALLSGGLLLVFIGAVSAALLRGIDLENCGCFSVSGAGRAAGIQLILGDLALLLAALVLAFVAPRAATPRPEVSPAQS
jgi:uncharacterized membrane protein YphA (DoxX/SURF4 family)